MKWTCLQTGVVHAPPDRNGIRKQRPHALPEILGSLPHDFSVPILVVPSILGKKVYTRKPRNALFRSMARDVGSGALAVILTGMGSDGAEGMKEVHDAGGYTIVQDRSTSVVYGTADFGVQLNAVCESLPIHEIAPRLVNLVATSPSGAK